jgi:hydrophobic/amphiphilic exporter-1 (mainly G- bacteria), HAE1 family
MSSPRPPPHHRVLRRRDLFLTILVVGFIATPASPSRSSPAVTPAQQLHVWVPWPNAPAQQVLDDITLPLEEELSTVRGLDASTPGPATTAAASSSSSNMAPTWTSPTARCATASNGPGSGFPDDVDRVFIRKEDASGIPVAVIGMAIDPGLTDYYTLLQREVIQPLERIDGVANVAVDGLEEKEILIEVDRASSPKPTA